MNQNIQSEKKINSQTLHIFSSVIVFLVGLALIIFNKYITGKSVVLVAGTLFILTGIVNIFIFVNRKDKNGRRLNTGFSLILGWAVSLAAILLGASMLCFENVFISLIPEVFGILIFLGAILLIFTFIISNRSSISTPIWLWICPVLMIGAGIFTFVQQPNVNGVYNDSLIMILTGSSFLVYSLEDIIVNVMIKCAIHKKNKISKSDNTDFSSASSSTQND